MMEKKGLSPENMVEINPAALYDAPPEYSTVQNDETGLTALTANLSITSKSKIPTPEQCIVHLKLLESLSLLREDISRTDGLYGLSDSFVPSDAPESTRNEVLSKIREKRWAVYVTSAAVRFQAWFQSLYADSNKITLENMTYKNYENTSTVGEPIAFTLDNLPPLDVLMVWHAATLNPRNWMSDCIRHGKMGLWQTGIPWATINKAIDGNCEYRPSSTASKFFETVTPHSWNSLDEAPGISLSCLMCSSNFTVPWTTCVETDQWVQSRDKAGERGTGYTDPGFTYRCQCSIIVNHELLATQKFKRDLQDLLAHDVPMAGTLLSLKGLTPPVDPETAHLGDKRNSTARMTYPNRLLQAMGEDEIAKDVSMFDNELGREIRYPRNKSTEDIRMRIEKAMQDRKVLAKAAPPNQPAKVRDVERIAIRKMMKCYWHNSSIFSMDLAGAVIRQGSFIEKMHSIDWLHSPAVHSTMERLVQKYERYIQIIATYPDKISVPTLDVDLAWHTHQTNPPSYYSYSVKRTGEFIDHDDKIEDSALSTAFEWTSKTYEKMFNQVYSECTCWYCESIRESHTSTLSRIVGSKSLASTDRARLHSLPNDNPHLGVHVSAHNAIPGQGIDGSSKREYVMKKQLERGYEKAVRRAKKEGRSPPRKDEYQYASVYGTPVAVGVYYPYMASPAITPGFYPANPACANYAAGAAGNCCHGTCGGGAAGGDVGAGGCGAPPGASCASGACGGGGASGGGGGCGGGGGGGGGGCGGGGGGGGC